jgi:hypothetical protein
VGQAAHHRQQGRHLYELTLAGRGISARRHLHPPRLELDLDGVAEAPDCILAAGYSNGIGSIFAFNLVTSGTASGTPTLDQGVQVAEFPSGEEVHSIQVYLGTYIAIGTSKGVRIGVLGSNGKMQYGPLTITTTKPVRSLAARDHYVYAAIEADIDGYSGCARIDLAEEINLINSAGYVTANSQRYAWAYDAQSHTTGVVYSVTFLGGTDRVVLAVDTNGIYLQSATDYETTGYLLTGRVRYATAENKTFSLIKDTPEGGRRLLPCRGLCGLHGHGAGRHHLHLLRCRQPGHRTGCSGGDAADLHLHQDDAQCVDRSADVAHPGNPPDKGDAEPAYPEDDPTAAPTPGHGGGCSQSEDRIRGLGVHSPRQS